MLNSKRILIDLLFQNSSFFQLLPHKLDFKTSNLGRQIEADGGEMKMATGSLEHWWPGITVFRSDEVATGVSQERLKT